MPPRTHTAAPRCACCPVLALDGGKTLGRNVSLQDRAQDDSDCGTKLPQCDQSGSGRFCCGLFHHKNYKYCLRALTALE
jgi:hypothetical protein